jgi:hydrogenase expression/formation protein HypD
MKYSDEFRNPEIVRVLKDEIHQVVDNREMTLMEVCGTHTMAIARFGLRSLLPANLRLISGPGCPVCVTSTRYIDHAIALSRITDVLITSFGDMIRVPGTGSSLELERGKGSDIAVVTSTLEALELAANNPEKRIVFLGVGFETTIPTIGVAIQLAKARNLQNFFVLSANKIMPPAMRALCQGDVTVDGFLCPGHVSTITGTGFYQEIVRDFGKGCVITGFEPTDILQGILSLCQQVTDQNPHVENKYKRSVRPEGNPQALAVITDVFEIGDAEWRGLGVIPLSGLQINSKYTLWDASVQIPVKLDSAKDPPGCRCGDVLTGRIGPRDCPLFGQICNPESPVGACMVSSEGSCAAEFLYGTSSLPD